MALSDWRLKLMVRTSMKKPLGHFLHSFELNKKIKLKFIFELKNKLGCMELNKHLVYCFNSDCIFQLWVLMISVKYSYLMSPLQSGVQVYPFKYFGEDNYSTLQLYSIIGDETEKGFGTYVWMQKYVM